MVDQRIAEKLHNEGGKIESFFSNLPQSQYEDFVYHDGQQWQIRDVLAHFISAERSFIQLFENIKNGGRGVSDDFLIDEFNNAEVTKMKSIDTSSLLALFIKTRTHTVKWVKGLSEGEIERTGKHPAMGNATLKEMIKMIYLHNQMHMRDLKAAIKPHLIDDI
jgi:hypothetical protein